MPPHLRSHRAGSSTDAPPRPRARPEPIDLDEEREPMVLDEGEDEPPSPGSDETKDSVLETLAKEHNYPTTRRMLQLLAQKGVRINRERVQAFVRGQDFRRALRPAKVPYNKGEAWHQRRARDHPTRAGVYNLGRPHGRIFADLVNFPPHKASRGYRYILLASDAFSRKLYGRKLSNTTGLEVARALREILHEIGGKPQEIMTDNGPEFKNADVRAMLEDEGVFQTFKEVGDFNTLAQLDSAIKTLKRSIALQKGKDPQFQWADHLQEVIDGENKVPRDHLLGANAEEIDKFGSREANFKESNLGFDLERMAADRLQLNEKNIDDREERLKLSGEFDAPITPKRTRFKRGDDVRWKTGLRVQHVEGNTVVDTEGKFRQVRRVVITQGNTEMAQAERYRALIVNWLQDRPERRARAGELAAFLRPHNRGQRPSIERLAQLLGFTFYKEGPRAMVRL